MTNIPAAVVEIHHQVSMETSISLGCLVVVGTASRLISGIGDVGLRDPHQPCQTSLEVVQSQMLLPNLPSFPHSS